MNSDHFGSSKGTAENLAEAIKNAPPMTKEQRFEQRVSFVYGQLNGRVAKEEIRRQILRDGW